MTTTTTTRQLVWAVFAILATLVVLSAFTVGFGMMGGGPMMGGMWGHEAWGHDMWGAGSASGWMFVVGVGLQLLFLAVIAGAAYLVYRAVTAQEDASDPALEEIRMAYARGELTDDEYEQRRERLENEP